MLVEIEGHTVPHFKAPIYSKLELWRLKYGGTLSIQTGLLKISCPNNDYEIVDLVFDVCDTFAEISRPRNCFISAAHIINLFGHLIKQYDMLEREQR